MHKDFLITHLLNISLHNINTIIFKDYVRNERKEVYQETSGLDNQIANLS